MYIYNYIVNYNCFHLVGPPLSLLSVENLLGTNTTLIQCDGPPELQYLANLNYVCKELGAGIISHRSSVLNHSSFLYAFSLKGDSSETVFQRES